MFETSIHWTTFFYLIIDFSIVLFVFLRSLKMKESYFDRYMVLGLLFILFNASGGFLPLKNFPGTLILQYAIPYIIGIILCVFVIHYIYQEYNICLSKPCFTIKNISIFLFFSFIILFLLSYYITNSLLIAKILFATPIAIFGICLLISFRKKLSEIQQLNSLAIRRNNFCLISVSSVVLLPVSTILGDYQWIVFTVMNVSFFSITIIKVDRYLYLLENKHKISRLSIQNKESDDYFVEQKLILHDLTPREIEIALSILDCKSYKKIGEEFFITEKTVSKHASNIFKKTDANNKKEFLTKFKHASLA